MRNDPFHRDSGSASLAAKTNLAAVEPPARNVEWIAEAYYSCSIFKGLRLAPDIQLYFAPALAPASGPIAIFTLRATAAF